MISSRALAALLPLGFLVACGTSTVPTAPTQPATPTLTLTPPALNINAGDAAVTFSATVQNSSETVTWVYSGPGTIAPATGPVTSFTPPASVASVQSGSLTAYLGSSGVQAVAAIAIYPASETPPEEPPTDPDPTPQLSLSIAEVEPVALGTDGKATVNLSASTRNAASGATYTWTAQGDNAERVSFGSATREDTTATFAGEGSYSLKLTVRSGSQTASDTVRVTVNPAPQSVTGTWAGTYEDEGEPGQFTLELKQTGDDVTGTVTEGDTTLPASGSFDGTNLALAVPVGNTTATIEASVSGDEMTGTIQGDVTVPFTAARQPAP